LSGSHNFILYLSSLGMIETLHYQPCIHDQSCKPLGDLQVVVRELSARSIIFTMFISRV
jgi:hypothetical protein